MSLFSIFSKKPPEATSVAEALAGTATPAKAKSRRSEKRQSETEDEQLVPEKKRARRRLIGAVAIVLAVVVGLPMVLDSEPRPLNKNIVIQIPSKDAVTPLPDIKQEISPAPDQPVSQPSAATVETPPKPVVAPPVAVAPVAPVVPVAPATLAAPKTAGTESRSDSRHVAEVNAKKETPVKEAQIKETPVKETPVKPKIETKVSDTHVASNDESARALAILGGTDPAARPVVRLVVQVGAFATQEKVNELQGKLAAAGIKSFTQKVATSSGDKIRVRVGPFSDKAAAEKMKLQLEKIGLNGSLIPL